MATFEFSLQNQTPMPSDPKQEYEASDINAGKPQLAPPETVTPQPHLRTDLFAKADANLVKNSFDGDVQSPVVATGWEMVVAPYKEPDWLPEGWTSEVRVRTSGASAGVKDKYYYDPESRRRFRSKNEVLNYIKTGKVGRYKPKTKTSDLDASGGIKSILNPEDSGLKGRTKSKVKTGGIKMKTEDSNANNLPSASTGSHKQDGSGLKRKSAPNVDFDFDNPPEKVTWVLCNAAEGTWKAYIDDEEVPEATLKVWREVTEYLLNNPSDDEQE